MARRPTSSSASPAPDGGDRSPPKAFVGGGIISLFVRHATAPNLLMLTLILIGLFAATRLNRQFFPNIVVPIISVNVAWPGASAEDVERNILDVLEPELRFIDDVDEVISYAREGNATITLEFPTGVDLSKAQSDVEQSVSRVTTLPEEAESPVISRIAFFDPVGKIAIWGPFSEQALKAYAKQIRDGLLNAGIDKVELEGARDEEIRIKLREYELRRLGISLDEVATRVRENTNDQPAGTLEGAAELQLRAGRGRKTAEEIANIEIKSPSSGEKIRLRDVAEITTAFDRDGTIGLVNGQRAIEISVQRSLTADTLKTMDAMLAYVETARQTLPPTLNIRTYQIAGELVQQRLNILVVNGLQGLALVLIILFIFLNARVAFWTAAGIPIAMLATLGVMYATGQSINMISMFGLIMMLGIVVDDAIVVGEHTTTLEQQGYSRLDAAEGAGHRMLAPVMAASLTTIAAFIPMMMISGRIGDILLAIPLVVIATLIASLVECFLILPGHLRHGHRATKPPNRIRRGVDNGVDWLRERVFGPLIDVAYAWRYTTAAVLIGGFIVAIGLMAGGRVNFVFFPTLPPENLTAKVEFAPGVPRPQQIAAIDKISDSLSAVEANLLQKANATRAEDAPEEKTLIVSTFSVVGKAGQSRGNNLAEMAVQLTSTETRTVRANDIISAWQKAVPDVPGVERITIAGVRGGPPGRDVDVRLQNAPIETLKRAAEELKGKLTGFPGISAISDDLPYGKQELVFELTPKGTALGFTSQSVGRQIRNAFEGAIATRFARADEEITVRVQRTQERDGITALNDVYLLSSNNERVPLTEIVTISERQNFSLIQRRDGVRTVAVTADLNTDVLTTEQAVERLEAEIMPELSAKYGITYAYAGRAEETGDSFRDLGAGSILALALIYIILGWVFADYWKPLAVMAIVPFGFVGAVIGHYMMGYAITIISMIGLLGLAGILVNDSIVMVSRLNERQREFGEPLQKAATLAARDRMRAVLLTSITTIAGLVPLMFETSLQAQFLIPLAVTIVFGVAMATVLVLILVPAVIGIGADIGRATGALRRLYVPRRRPAPEPAE
ncbi:MAG: efflux RND transporter permease subunit [Pseudomonadota bacterium]